MPGGGCLMMGRVTRALMLLALTIVCAGAPSAQTLPAFQVEEASIGEIHEALKSGRLTCRALVERYLRRIEAYD